MHRGGDTTRYPAGTMATDTPVSDLQEGLTTAVPLVPQKSATASNEISFLDLLIVLAERKRLILWITAVFAIVSTIVSLLLPKSYTAIVTLLPPQQNSS